MTTKTKYTIAAAAVAGMLLMFCGMMAFHSMFPPDVSNGPSAKYQIERANLQAELNTRAHVIEAMEAREQNLLQTIDSLKQKPKQIQKAHETIRTENWNLNDSAALELWHERLRAERHYRHRFQYNY